MKKIIFSILLILFSASIVSAEQVTFNGAYSNGTTLYSDFYSFNNYTFSGKDVYPVITEGSNIRVKTCETLYKETRKRVCNFETYYAEQSKKFCDIINNKRVCYYENVLVPRHKYVCEVLISQKPYEKCKYTTVNYLVIGCLNPNGEYTNQLRLENFKYSTDGINWLDITYSPISVTGALQFKVSIPEKCSPAYEINNAINLR